MLKANWTKNKVIVLFLLDFALVFETLPKALSLMPASNVWVVFLFLMMLLINMNFQVPPI